MRRSHDTVLIATLFALMCCCCCSLAQSATLLGFQEAKEQYQEQVFLTGLADGSLLTNYQFITYASGVWDVGDSDLTSEDSYSHVKLQSNYNLVSKAIGQILQQYEVDELRVSMTQGRWLSSKWGSSTPFSSEVSPPGTELFVWFAPPQNDTNPTKRTNTLWRGLTQALSGLLCTSLSTLSSSRDLKVCACCWS